MPFSFCSVLLRCCASAATANDANANDTANNNAFIFDFLIVIEIYIPFSIYYIYSSFYQLSQEVISVLDDLLVLHLADF